MSDIERERREAADLLLGDPRYAALVTGETVAEMIKSAAEVARTLREYHAEQEASRIPPGSFDGGCRQPPPPPPPSHDEVVADLLARHPRGDGTGWGQR